MTTEVAIGQVALSPQLKHLKKMLGKPDEVCRLKSYVRNGQREQLLELFTADPGAIAKAWKAAQKCEPKKKQEAIRYLSDLIYEMGREGQERFMANELLVKPDMQKIWPAVFYRQAPFKIVWALAKLLGVGTLKEPLHRLSWFAVWLITSGNPLWAEVVCFKGGEEDPRTADFSEFLDKTLGLSILSGQLPLPCGGGLRIDQLILKTGECIVSCDLKGNPTIQPLEDPKGKLILEGIEWPFESRECPEPAGKIVTSFLIEYRMPKELVEKVRQVGERRDDVLNKIVELWREICLSTGDDPPRILKRWIPGHDLFAIEPTLAGVGSEETALVSIRLNPADNFPEIKVCFVWSLWGWLMDEETLLDGETGLLTTLVVYPEGDDEWNLRLWLNLALVQELHRIAFAEGYCKEGRPAEDEDDMPKRSTRAVLPHFRRLCKGTTASNTAIKRAKKLIGMKPPFGYTFAASPPIYISPELIKFEPIVLQIDIGCP